MTAVLLPALERHGRVTLDEATRAKLLEVSAATIDRLLAGVRLVAGSGRRRPAGFGAAVRRSVPIRTFNDWGNPAPGWVEVDFVAHGGTTVSGAFVQTIVLTDVATGWTECIPIVVRKAEMVVHALGRARELFPFPLRGVDFDNDSLFMNDLVVGWCRTEELQVTRSRAYRKNDQAWVEQKNGAIVRRLVGYGRFEGVLAGRALAGCMRRRACTATCSSPRSSCRRSAEGARVIKRNHAPEPPVMRALTHAAVPDANKSRLRAMLAGADPVLLLAAIRLSQTELGKRVDERGMAAGRAETPVPLDLALFTASLRVAWEAGEQRPTHRRRYVRVKPIMRPSMLDAVRDQLLAWLEAQPALTAVAALNRLRARPCCTDRRYGRSYPSPGCFQAMRTEIGLPRSSMRFRTWTATFTSVARRSSARERSPSPITCLNLPMAASARARFVYPETFCQAARPCLAMLCR